jgi:hypothetical protein
MVPTDRRDEEGGTMTRLMSLAVFMAAASSGCVSVTTKVTGSTRSGAEELLLTGTADRAVATIDFSPLAGRKGFLETGQVSATDSTWIIFSLRRAMARQGLLLVADKKDAQTVVEASVAAYATDEVDTRLSLPSTVSAGLLPIPIASTGTSALIRKNRQDSVVKMALFGYDAKTSQLAWESDTIMEVDRLDRRFFGKTNVTRATSLPVLETYPPRDLRYSGRPTAFDRQGLAWATARIIVDGQTA